MIKALLLATVILSAQASSGTQCAHTEPLQTVHSSKYVFLGRVSKIEGDRVQMEIAKNFGAPISKVIQLDFSQKFRPAGDLGIKEYELGKQYLIATGNYAAKDSEAGSIKPHFCDLQIEAAKSKDLLELIRRIRPKAH